MCLLRVFIDILNNYPIVFNIIIDIIDIKKKSFIYLQGCYSLSQSRLRNQCFLPNCSQTVQNVFAAGTDRLWLFVVIYF